MAPKKKKTKKVKKVVTPPPRKSQYIARIAEMNEILAQLRKETFYVEDLYLNAENRYKQVQEDLADTIQYLEYEIKVLLEEISNYDREIDKYDKEIQKEKKYYETIYSEMDVMFEEKKRSLTEVIESMEAKLNACEEIRRQREEYLKRREHLKKMLEEMKLRHSEEMYEREKQVIIEQDTLQKDMEKRLDQLALDLREATDVRIGETTNRIIGDNINLGNLLTCQHVEYIKIKNNFTAIKKIERQASLDVNLKKDEYETTLNRYSEGATKIEDLLKSIAVISERTEELKRLVKINRRLKRKIAELECYSNELANECKSMVTSLNEVDDAMAGSKGNLFLYQRNIIRLQFSLFDAAKKIKEAIECENIHMEKEEIQREEAEADEIEERERENAYRIRELLIEEILLKLQPRNLSIYELYTTSSYEIYEHDFSYQSLGYSSSSKKFS